ncbi:MAG: YhgE/Pip domain-containing protein [Rhodoferax sp.]|uniref:YhgE/Pip domain-containing protein n=1 Tax=Rhodoferax sp. TaxID=50421 RepID=UPI0026317B6C|nr:YhgE/Pip domain-containing protein [Rhodoferax sp.]MDD2880320.1 YhgE/Pip domain-containing protein [Rhodoferax sp.]
MKPEGFFKASLALARLEAHFFLHYPRMLMAAAVVVLIPALYVLIYLTSVWDPAAKTGALPVAIVNLDQGLEYRGQAFNVGRDLAQRLRLKPAFGYVDEADEQKARHQVRSGALAFALIVPKDFSSNAIPGAQAGAGKLVIFTSEGNSYPSAGLARRFAEDLGREVNQSLNEQRWALVLADAAGSQRSLVQLQDAVAQLRHGATELAGGAQQLSHGAEQLTRGAVRLDQGVGQLGAGVKELGGGLRSMFAQRPRNSDLRRLDEGAQALVIGHDELGKGLTELQLGSTHLQKSIDGFREEADSSLFVATQVKDGLGQLGQGVATLDTGLKSAVVGQQKLSDGAVQLNTGVGTLTTGLRTLNAGLRTMVTELPDDSKLDELSRGAGALSSGASALKQGTVQVMQGAQHLAGGLDLLAQALPAAPKTMDGNAQGLANSVQPAVEVAAPVQNNGSAFAANIVPGALWLGASLAAFLIRMRSLPLQARYYPALARVVGKVAVPMVLVLLQALLVWLAMLWVLQIHAVHKGALALIFALAGVTFLWIVFALTRAFGDAGKALALIFLAVQLSSSGGILPVELSGGLFAKMSPYLPITWVVTAIKAALFGAFDGHWQGALQWVLLWAVLAALAASFLGRWRFVRPSALRPVLDL